MVRLRCRKAFNFLIFHTNSFHVAENSVHISSRLLVCVCTFLLVDKIVYGLSAFGDACFSFCIKSFPIFRIINSLGECSSSSSIFEILVKFQSFLLGRMTIFTFFFFAVLVAKFEFASFAPKQKYMASTVSMAMVCTTKSRPRKNQSERTDLPKTGFAI